VGGTVTTGWHSDPFGVHEARYFSADGLPTKLVRDRGVESYDEPPSEPDEVAAAMARMSAMPEPPSASAYRDPYPHPHPHERAPERDSWRPSLGRFAVTWMIAVAAAVAIVLVAQVVLRAPKPASPQGGTTDIAFVTQAATRTLQQRTVDLVMSATTTAGRTNSGFHGTGALDLGGKAGTLDVNVDSKAYAMAIREILVNGYVYVGISVNGRSLLPAGKAWIAQQAPFTQGSGMTDLTGADPAATLASLENQGISVRALGTKDVGGVSCAGYAVTPPGAQGTVTVWINPQHLVREISVGTSITISADVPAAGASPSASPVGIALTGSFDLTMDFAYSAAPVHVTAPPAAATMSYDAFLRQLGQAPVPRQLEPSGAS
jgi:hypothetical protein